MKKCSHSAHETLTELNITPLLDLAFVLLVIFIITAPLFTHAIRLDLPKVASQVARETPETITLSIDDTGKIYWNDKPTTLEQMRTQFVAEGKRATPPEIHLRASSATRYDVIAQVMGAALDVMRNVAATLEIEANGVSDNPLVFAYTREALSGGNFHAEPVALAADTLALAACEIGSLAERRIAMLVDPALSGLPAFLTPKPGLNSGFMLAQVTAAALASELKTLAHPASADTIPTSGNKEDHVSMSMGAGLKAQRALELARYVIAIEFLCACQAIDLLRPLATSPPLSRVHDFIRARVPALAEDRSTSNDLKAITEMIASGEVERACALKVN